MSWWWPWEFRPEWARWYRRLLPCSRIRWRLCLGILAIITIINLRGVREAGLIIMLPTYLFVGCLGIAILIGLAKTLLEGGHPVPVIAPPAMGPATEAVRRVDIIESLRERLHRHDRRGSSKQRCESIPRAVG